MQIELLQNECIRPYKCLFDKHRDSNSEEVAPFKSLPSQDEQTFLKDRLEQVYGGAQDTQQKKTKVNKEQKSLQKGKQFCCGD